MTPSSIRKNFLLTYPRTASNLLIKILALEDQPSLVPGSKRDYFFLSSLGHKFETAGKPLAEWSLERKAALKQSNQKCFETLQESVDIAQAQGKDIFVKEHLPWMIEPVSEARFVFGPTNTSNGNEESWTVKVFEAQTHSALNETVFPDEFLKTWFPTFLIRHPALVFPSIYRTSVDLEGREAARAQARGPHLLEMTMHWSRTLYDWYQQHQDILQWTAATDSISGAINLPIILDADDIIFHPEIVCKYSKMVGLDPHKLKFSWEAASKDDLGKLNFAAKRMLSTILSSSGILHDKAARTDLDIDGEEKKWRKEFGEEEARNLRMWVEAAMPDYQHMFARRLRP